MLIRAGQHREDEAYSTVDEHGPPPEEKARHANRMSPAGSTMFYGSDMEETPLAEIDRSGFATVAQ